jgi:hypothetical protein
MSLQNSHSSGEESRHLKTAGILRRLPIKWLISLSRTSPRKSFAFNGSILLISRRRLPITTDRLLLRNGKEAPCLLSQFSIFQFLFFQFPLSLRLPISGLSQSAVLLTERVGIVRPPELFVNPHFAKRESTATQLKTQGRKELNSIF